MNKKISIKLFEEKITKELFEEKITKELEILTNTSILIAGISDLPFDEAINIIIDTLQNQLENVKLAYKETNNE